MGNRMKIKSDLTIERRQNENNHRFSTLSYNYNSRKANSNALANTHLSFEALNSSYE